jgi:hypothetical protein
VADRNKLPKDLGVKAYLDGIADPKRKADCQALLRLMKSVTKSEAVLWAASVVGFGTGTYTYPSGRTMEWLLIGFSSGKKDLTIHITPSLGGCADLLARLGPHKQGKSCIYISALAAVNTKALKELLTRVVTTHNGSGG